MSQQTNRLNTNKSSQIQKKNQNTTKQRQA